MHSRVEDNYNTIVENYDGLFHAKPCVLSSYQPTIPIERVSGDLFHLDSFTLVGRKVRHNLCDCIDTHDGRLC